MLMSECLFVWHKVSKTLNLHHSGSYLQVIIKGSSSDLRAVFEWSSRGFQEVFNSILRSIIRALHLE